MPLYSFEDIKTGEEIELMLSYDELKKFKADNPQLQQTYSINLVGSVGGIKTDDLFKDEVLGRIGEHHAGTEMGDRYGKKTIKEVKTQKAVEKWRKKRSSDPRK